MTTLVLVDTLQLNGCFVCNNSYLNYIWKAEFLKWFFLLFLSLPVYVGVQKISKLFCSFTALANTELTTIFGVSCANQNHSGHLDGYWWNHLAKNLILSDVIDSFSSPSRCGDLWRMMNGRQKRAHHFDFQVSCAHTSNLSLSLLFLSFSFCYFMGPN